MACREMERPSDGGRRRNTIYALCFVLVAVSSAGADNLALLSGTLRTIQRAACDGETLALRCPLGTAVSIQLAQYGRPAPGLALCPEPKDSPFAVGSANFTESCTITPPMQHALLQTVVEACTRKRHCKFSTSASAQRDASTAVIPVPSPQACNGVPPRFVEVAYKCRPLEFRSKIICENETIQLKCKRNARIAVYSAMFGRVQFQSAQCLQPPGVEDETCEASFSTETVMQVCHGKRRCSLTASSATFGNPCNPMSHLYLRIVYTCVSRSILKDHYQGDVEPDEAPAGEHGTPTLLLDNEDFMSENSFESDDYAEPAVSSSSGTATPPPPPPPQYRHPYDGNEGGVIGGVDDRHRDPAAASAASANDHAANYRTTNRPFGDQHQTRREGFFGEPGVVVDGQDDGDDDDDMLGDIGDGDSSRRRQRPFDRVDAGPAGSDVVNASHQQNVFSFITGWITSVSIVKENQEKFILYLALSIAAGILVLLTLLIGRLWWQKRRAKRDAKSLHSSDPIPAFADDVSDVDNDIDLTSLSLPPPPPLLSELTSLNGTMAPGPVPSAEGVRGYVVPAGAGVASPHAGLPGTMRRSAVAEENDNHPRSFIRNGNSHYYYG